jgi:FkbM family methyltransferase
MYFFKSRLKESLRALFDGQYIPSVSVQEIIERIGAGAIRNFIQIGSNDGIKNDPLRKYILSRKWSGILVEPDYHNFQNLVQNYTGIPGLVFENTGIAEKAGSLVFHYVEGVSEKDPGWFDQIGSFDENTFRKNIAFSPGLAARRRTKEIAVITIGELLEKHGVQRLDLLHTDTEGYDFRILNSIDFAKLSPRVVIFESEWMTRYELGILTDRFRALHYNIFKDGADHIACK